MEMAPSTFSPASASHRGFALLPWHKQLGCLHCKQVLVLDEEEKIDVGRSKSTRSIDFFFRVWGQLICRFLKMTSEQRFTVAAFSLMIRIVRLKHVSCHLLFMLSSKHCWCWWTCFEVWPQSFVEHVCGCVWWCFEGKVFSWCNQHTQELIGTWKTSHKHSNKDHSRLR